VAHTSRGLASSAAKAASSPAFTLPTNSPMHVVLRFSADQAPYVKKREWHPSQRLTWIIHER
jgi:hypothetical protein